MRKLTVLGNPFSYLCVTSLFTIIGVIILAFTLYYSHLHEIRHNLSSETDNLESTLNDVFEQTNQLVFHIGKQIASSEAQDIKTVASIIGRDQDETFEVKNALSWMVLGWVSPSQQLLFDWQQGPCSPPIDLSHRPYLKECIKEPWKLHLSRACVSVTNALREIPGGIGITDNKGKYLGTLSVGFNLVALNNKLKAALHHTNLSYIILDKNLRIVLQSPDNAIDPDSSYYKDLLDNDSLFSGGEGNLLEPIHYKNIKYSHYKKITNYPYYILTGFDRNVLNKSFQTLIFPRIIELIAMAMLGLALIHLLRRNMLSAAKTSEEVKNAYQRQLKEEMNESLQQILLCSDLLRKALRKEIEINLSPDKMLNIAEKIYQTSLNVNTFNSENVNYSYVNVNDLIQECITIQLHSAFIRGSLIKSSLCPNLPLFWGDELRLKQLILGLIGLSFQYSPKDEIIKISTSLKIENNQAYLIISLQDKGFALDESTIRRISENFISEGPWALNDNMSLDLPSIDQLVELHQGTFQLDSAEKMGKNIIITFPYLSATEEKAAYEANLLTINNTFKLTKIKKDLSNSS